MHYIHIGLTPNYLSDCVSTVSAASGRYRLRSTGSEAYILSRTRTRFGERGFFYSGPAAWNTVPSDLHYITDTSTFRKRLKNVLFDRAFNWFSWRSWTCRIAAPYKFCVDWLIDWLVVVQRSAVVRCELSGDNLFLCPRDTTLWPLTKKTWEL